MALVGTLVDRPNRFVLTVDLPDGDRVRAYCPNTSRLRGLYEPGRRAWVRPVRDPARMTDYTVTRIRDGGTWVGIVAQRANDLFRDHLKRRDRTDFGVVGAWKREVRLGTSRIDFAGAGRDARPRWVEVKSLSSGAGGAGRRFAFYSGTPSRRTYRQLEDLSRAVEAGHRAWCVFVVQRPDVGEIRPGPRTEAGWLESLRSAREHGVRLRGFRCDWDGEGTLRVAGRLPTRLDDPAPADGDGS